MDENDASCIHQDALLRSLALFGQDINISKEVHMYIYNIFMINMAKSLDISNYVVYCKSSYSPQKHLWWCGAVCYM